MNGQAIRPQFGQAPAPRKGRRVMAPQFALPLANEPLRLVGETLPAPVVRAPSKPRDTTPFFPNL